MTVPSPLTTDPADEARDAFALRMAETSVAAGELATIYLGRRLGLYRALAESSPLAAPQLADAAGIHPRYAREWLEQQCVAGILSVENPVDPPDERRYQLPTGHDEVLTHRDSLAYMMGGIRIIASYFWQLEAVIDAFKSGRGVDYAGYNPDASEGMNEGNRAQYLQVFAQEWIPAMPDVLERLQSDPPARCAEIGGGGGWTAIGLAREYPKIRVDGYELDAPSVEAARRNASEFGVADRVRFHVQDVTQLEQDGGYDLVYCSHVIHDLAYPTIALRAMRRMATPGGVVIVEEPVYREFTGKMGNLDERFFFLSGVLHCLPVAFEDDDSEAPGAPISIATLEHHALEAGFSRIEHLPVKDESVVSQLFRLHL